MKKITMFTMQSCPYCQAAERWMKKLFTENNKYSTLEIEKIDELAYPEIAEKYDYWHVPTYYVGDEKAHEGAASLRKIRKVFDMALEGQ